jgi:hypothetical protein
MTITEEVTYTDEEIKAHRLALLEALETEKYPQGYGRLVTEKSGQLHCCCIGVACLVAGIPYELGGHYPGDGGFVRSTTAVFENEVVVGPNSLNVYYGETAEKLPNFHFNPQVLWEGIRVRVSMLNDGFHGNMYDYDDKGNSESTTYVDIRRHTHPEIAALLRQKWGL